MRLGAGLKHLMAGLSAGGLLLGVAGCQSSDGGGLNLGLGGAKAEPPAPSETISAEELRAYCPRVTLRSGTAFYNSYEKGGQDDPAKITYQASISEVTRSCNYGSDMLTMNVAAAGKVVPGPVARDGSVTMPIRVVVVRGDEVLYSKLHPYAVQIAAKAAATQFVFSDTAVTFPIPSARNVEVLVGFDEGPAKKK